MVILINYLITKDKSSEEILKNIDNLQNEEDKLIQLHDLVVNQRKTIDNLSKLNQELTNTVFF